MIPPICHDHNYRLVADEDNHPTKPLPEIGKILRRRPRTPQYCIAQAASRREN